MALQSPQGWANYYWAIIIRFKGFNRRIVDEFQEAQDDQFWGIWGLEFVFVSSGTPKIGSGRSKLYIGRWSRGCLTPQIAGTKPFSSYDPDKDGRSDGRAVPFLACLVPKMCPKKVASRGLKLVLVASGVCWYKPSKLPT